MALDRTSINRLGQIGPDEPVAAKVNYLYRISDSSLPKERFEFATKRTCLANFIDVFAPSHNELTIIADSVGDDTWKLVNLLHSNAIRTNFQSGAQSWRFAAFDVALAQFPDDVFVYFVEDDYLHLPASAEILREGLAISHYVSLYDHSDKYDSGALRNRNPYVVDGGELTRVVRTPSVHWKLTNSTTMTFAAKVATLREDAKIWEKHTRGPVPGDFPAFLELARKGRSLITPIPGSATHCEPAFASPGIDWEEVARKSNDAYATDQISTS